jgi:hypothetical protein
MPRPARRACGPVRPALALVLFALSGCGESPEDGAVRLSPPAGWFTVEPSQVVVPGRCLSAWGGPGGSSLALVETIRVPRGDAAGLAKELTSRLENLPGLRIDSVASKPVGGVEAAWVEVVAPGTGDALSPSGLGKAIAPKGRVLVPTRRVQIGLPLKAATYWIIFTHPESDATARAVDVEAVAKSVTVRDPGVVTSSY